jgi:hypothetical protein
MIRFTFFFRFRFLSFLLFLLVQIFEYYPNSASLHYSICFAYLKPHPIFLLEPNFLGSVQLVSMSVQELLPSGVPGTGVFRMTGCGFRFSAAFVCRYSVACFGSNFHRILLVGLVLNQTFPDKQGAYTRLYSFAVHYCPNWTAYCSDIACHSDAAPPGPAAGLSDC